MVSRLLKILMLIALAAAAGCTSSPRYRSHGSAPKSTVGVGDKSVEVGGKDVIEKAQDYLGTPYRMGGTTTNGLDCSGLVYTVYRSFGITVPRTSADQSRFGAEVGRYDLQPGDLVFFRTSSGSKVSHVGIYSGSGEFIHASTRSKRVKFDRLDNKYFKKRYVTARRVL